MARNALTATQLLRPASPLLRNPLIAKTLGNVIAAENRWSDPYALAGAFGSLGTGYDAMNKSLGLATKTQDEMALSDAYRAAGFAPAAAEAAVSGARYIAAKNQSDTEKYTDIQQAFQAAMDEGLRPGTPQFSLFMHDHLRTARGVAEDDKAYATAKQQLQREANQHTALETGMKQLMRQKAAQEYVNAHQNEFYLQSATPEERAKARLQLQRDATDYADKKLEGHDLQLTKDPQSGVWTAQTDDGQTLPIPPQLAAVAAKIGGDSSMYDALKGVYDMSRTADANARANAANVATIDQKEALAAQAQARAAAALQAKQTQHDMTVNNPRLKRLDAEYKDLSAQLKEAVKAGDKDEIDALTKKIADNKAEFDSMYVLLGNTLPPRTGPAPGAGAANLGGGAPTAAPAATTAATDMGSQQGGATFDWNTPANAEPVTPMAPTLPAVPAPMPQVNVSLAPPGTVPPSIGSTGGGTQMFGIPDWLQWMQAHPEIGQQVTEEQMQQAGVPAIVPNY